MSAVETPATSFEVRPMSPEDFAEASTLSIRTVYAMLADGRLAGRKFGRRWVIPASEVARQLA